MSIQQNKKKIHKSLSTTALHPDPIKLNSYTFPDASLTRTSNLKVSNINGYAAEVLFKRPIHVSQNYNLNLKDSGYIVDGGINQKYLKLIKPKVSSKQLSQSFSQKNIKASNPSSIHNSSKKETHKVLKSQKSAGNLLLPSSMSSGINASVIKEKKINKTAQIPKPKKNKNYFSSKNSSRLSNSNNIKKNKNKSINVGCSNVNNSSFYNSKKWNSSTKIEKNSDDNSKKKRKMMRSYSQGELIGSSLSNKYTNQEELKNAQIEYLVDTGVNSYLRELRKKDEKDKSKEKFYKKQKVLEHNNQDSLELESAVTDLSHNSHEEADNSKGSIDKNSSGKKLSKSQKMQAHYNKKRKDDTNFMTIITRNKKVLKCRVDQFEYLKQIYKQQKIKNNNYIIGDSFRQTTSPNKDKYKQNQNLLLVYSKEQQVNDEKNKQIELRKYMKKKRFEEKRKQEHKEFEKNKELLQLYGRIYPLNKGNIGDFETTYKTNVKSKSTNTIDRDKETYRNTESTVVAANEFYYSTFVCQQLIGMDEKDILNLNLQDSESQSNQNKLDNFNSIDKLSSYQSEDFSSLGVSISNKQREQKITGVIPGMKAETNKKIEGLKNKVDKTLNKAEDIYKKEEIEELIKSGINKKDKKNEGKKKLNKPSQKESINQKQDRLLLKDSLKVLKEVENQKKENIDQQRKSPQICEDYKTTSEQVLGTKERNLPSLSHSYNSNTNPNNEIKVEMEPRCVLNLVEIIKLIVQRRALGTLYEIFINEMLYQRYTIAFAYFISIIKQYPYRKIEAYMTYKSYYKVFKTLFNPFIRRNFYYFIMKVDSYKRIEYLVDLLTKFIKLKSLEKIYIYGMVRQSQLEGEAFMDILTKIVKCVSRPSLIEHFSYFVNNSKKLKKDNKNKKPTEQIQKKDRNIHNKEIKDPSLHISNESKSLEQLMIIPGEFENEDTLKMNTYLYESIINTSKDASSYILECNSTDSPKLRRLFQKYLAKNEGEFDVENMKQKVKRRTNPFQINNVSKRQNFEETQEEQIRMFLKKKYEQKENHSNLLNESDLCNKSFKSFHGISNNKIKLDLTIFGNSNITDKSLLINTEHNRGRKINKKLLKFSSLISNKNPTPLNKNLQIKTNILDNSDINNIVQPKTNELRSEKDRIFLPSSPSQKNDIIQSVSFPHNKMEKNDKELSSPINSSGNLIKKKKSLEIHTDQDYSIDKESNTDIDWQYCLSSSKIQGKELTDNTNIVNKKGETLSEETNKISPISKQIEAKKHEVEKNNDNLIRKTSDDENQKKEQLIEDNRNEDNRSKRQEINDKKDDSYGDEFEQGNYSSKSSFDTMDNIIGAIRNEVNQEQQKQNINDKSRNTPHTISSKLSDQDKSKTTTEDINKFVQEQHIINKKELFAKVNKDELTKDLIKEIVESLLKTEIKNSKRIIPTKPLTYKDNGGNNSVNPSISLSRSGSLCNSNPEIKASPTNSCISDKKETSVLPQISTGTGTQNYLNPMLADSLYFTPFTYSSIFNKTVKEKKKEQSTQLYNTKIGPELIKLIKDVIISKYQLIYENISSPYQNLPEGLMTSLSLQDPELLRINYRVPPSQLEIAEIIDKPKILNEFIPINKKIRLNENFTSEENSDAMLNNCLVDSAIELINKERIYGDQGNPLPWSNRTREIKYKYEKNNPHKLANFIESELLKLLNNKIGMITENYDYMNIDQINMERERKLVEMIRVELKENENIWNNLEMEETQLKVELTELILEQLYNEVIEILEHIEYSRKKPELYQHKSIFACEEIPKLTFQVTGTEEQEEDNDWTRM